MSDAEEPVYATTIAHPVMEMIALVDEHVQVRFALPYIIRTSAHCPAWHSPRTLHEKQQVLCPRTCGGVTKMPGCVM